ncbi:IclR family transcriptional regulator [Alkalihalobacillus sp. BA299]|uniref:IclR family transcriptional regulator n=1 Tax=Alkalihalobacillus sp. BA299 TaxID=2815938 RepID=UPI001ADB1F16|nr:IclR family transcriptional regulator [Alkalihalobacillus sp. BA299]
MHDKSIVQSVEKAAAILRLFSKKDPKLTLSEISKRTSFNKTTALRLCNTLEKVGFIEKVYSSSTPYYRLGIELFKIGSAILHSLDITSRAKPHLKRITELTGDNSYLFIEKNNLAHCIDTVKGDYLVRDTTTELGDTYNLNQGGGPLAMLAFLDNKKKFEVFNALNLSNEEVRKLDDRLDQIRAKGYSISRGEIYRSAAAMGAPILDFQGNVIGALSVGGIIDRFSDERMPHIVEVLTNATEELSREFGWEGKVVQ